MGVFDTIKNFFSSKPTKKKVSKEALEHALRRFARENGLKYRPGMAESAASLPAFLKATRRSRRSRLSRPHLSRASEKTVDKLLMQAKRTDNEEVIGVVLEILEKMIERERGASPTMTKAKLEQVKAVVENLKTRTPKGSAKDFFGPEVRPQGFKTPKGSAIFGPEVRPKTPMPSPKDFFGPEVRPQGFKTPRSPSGHEKLRLKVRELMAMKDIDPSLLEALANWVQMDDTNRTRAEHAAANAERTKELRDNAAKALALPRQAIQVTRKAVANRMRGVGDWWRRGTKVVRNAFGFKGATPPPNVWSEPNATVTLNVKLTDENENGQQYEYAVKANTSNRVEDLVAKISEQHESEHMDLAFNGQPMKAHHPMYYYGLRDGANVTANVPMRYQYGY